MTRLMNELMTRLFYRTAPATPGLVKKGYIIRSKELSLQSKQTALKQFQVLTHKRLFEFLVLLEGTARCAGLLLAPAEGFGLWLKLFFCKTKKLFMLCVPILGHFWCSLVTP